MQIGRWAPGRSPRAQPRSRRVLSGGSHELARSLHGAGAMPFRPRVAVASPHHARVQGPRGMAHRQRGSSRSGCRAKTRVTDELRDRCAGPARGRRRLRRAGHQRSCGRAIRWCRSSCSGSPTPRRSPRPWHGARDWMRPLDRALFVRPEFPWPSWRADPSAAPSGSAPGSPSSSRAFPHRSST